MVGTQRPADEPTGNLDRTSGQEVMALLRRVNQELEVTVLLATHDPELPTQADRRLALLDGRLVA